MTTTDASTSAFSAKSLIALVPLAWLSAIPTASYAYDGTCSTPQDITDLPPGHWCEVPDSHLRAVEKKPDEYPDWNGSSSESYDSYQRQSGLEAVIGNWSGGAYDSLRDRLLVMGGGHNGYGGNEVYAFDLDTLEWTRLTDPTPFPNRCTSENDDHTPVSRHTYGGLAYLENVDKFFVVGGAPDCATGGSGVEGTWLLDLGARESAGVYSTSQWDRVSPEPDTSSGDDAVYDLVTGRVYYHWSPNPSGWASYHPPTDTWTTLSSQGINNGAAVVIPGTRRFIIEFGAGLVDGYFRWGDLGSDSFDRSIVPTTGAKAMETESNPGAAYDWQTDRVVSWSGGATVYSLNVDTNVWQEHPPADTNLADPGPVNTSGGTYGRFAYSTRLNVFVVVDSVDENVFVYRFSLGSGIIPPARPKPPSNVRAQ